MGIINGVDTSSMGDMINYFPEMIGAVDIPSVVRKQARDVAGHLPQGIVMAGMGGSSIAGQYCKGLLVDESRLPLIVRRDYTLPGYVNDRWMMIAVSYSGNTAETLSCYAEARRRDCDCFIISSGGKLSEQGAGDHIIPLPEGFQPRAALPMIFSAEFQLVRNVLGIGEFDLKTARESVKKAKKKWGQNVPDPGSLADRLHQKIPVFMGAHHLDAVAYRAKCQINENAKSVAFQLPIPESNHNEVEAISNYSKHGISVILIRSSFESREISKRFNVTRELYEEENLDVHQIHIELDDRVAEILALTHFFDDLSLQLAMSCERDPVGVPMISRLKEKMTR